MSSRRRNSVRSLNEVPMSVTENMMRRFLRDMTTYCGRQATESYRALHFLISSRSRRRTSSPSRSD